MSELQMGIVESKFADIIWRTAPVTSSQLVKLEIGRASCRERV